MIEVAVDTLFLLYLAFVLTVLLSFWVSHLLRARRQQRSLLDHQLLVCEYCQNVYLDDVAKEVTQCPQCRSYNKNNPYRT